MYVEGRAETARGGEINLVASSDRVEFFLLTGFT
jgi:hypothetical protein